MVTLYPTLQMYNVSLTSTSGVHVIFVLSSCHFVQLGARKGKGGLGAKKLNQSFSEIESQAEKEDKLRSDQEHLMQKQEADFK